MDFNMLSLRLNYILLLLVIPYINGQRRIRGGFQVQGEKRYMIYLIQAKYSIRNYNSWICGGSIVTRWFILTSAACVEDVQSMYAISGTRSYVSSANIHKHTCTKNTMKKVVFTCVPKEYKLDYSKVENWSFNDIALVKVETAYDFDDEKYLKYCSYKPNAININFDIKNEKKGTEVIVLGFGHLNFWRETSNNQDWNQRSMQYSASKIFSIKKCKSVYKSPDLNMNIEKYMICTNGSGNTKEKFSVSIDQNSKGLNNKYPLTKMRSARKCNNITLLSKSRRQGFCQNDHGGPLVGWINNEETVLGVASVFRVNKEQRCTGPYLYTSTARNKLFIECILSEQMTRRDYICNLPASEKGFSILRRYILWNENEDHVVNNEEIIIRPQINMNFIGMG